MERQTFEERMEGHVASLTAALDQEEAAALRARAEAQEHEGNAERLRGAIGKLRGSTPPKAKRTRQPTRRENGVRTGHGISLEATRPVHDYILQVTASGQKTFNQKDIYKPLDLDQSRGSSAFKFLRTIGFLRLAGRDLARKCDMYAVMDVDAFEKIWAETFDRDHEQEAAALRERLRNGDGSTPENRLDLVAAYLREKGSVRGWSTVTRELDLPKHGIADVKATLINLGLVKVDTVKGRPSTIEWVADSEIPTEVLNGAA